MWQKLKSVTSILGIGLYMTTTTVMADVPLDLCTQPVSSQKLQQTADAFVHAYLGNKKQVRTDLMSEQLLQTYLLIAPLQVASKWQVAHSKSPSDKPFVWENNLISGNSDSLKNTEVVQPQVYSVPGRLAVFYQIAQGVADKRKIEMRFVCEGGQYKLANVYYGLGEDLQQDLQQFVAGVAQSFIGNEQQ